MSIRLPKAFNIFAKKIQFPAVPESTEVKLTLPYPISANRYWRMAIPKGRRNPVIVVSPDAHKYRKVVAIAASHAGIESPIKGRVSVSYVLYPNRPKDYAKREKRDPDNWDDSVQCIDLDNAQKVLFDSMKNIVFEDDKWIWNIKAERAVPDGLARVEVIIRKL